MNESLAGAGADRDGERVLEFEIGLVEVDETEAAALLDGVFESGPHLRAAPIRGALDLPLLVLAGTAAIEVLANRLTIITTELRKKGMIVDVRDGACNIDERSNLPAGVIVVVADDAVEVHDLRQVGSDMAAILRAAPSAE